MQKQNVICAIDVNDFDQDVIDLAAKFADHFGVGLDILHVSLFPDPTVAAWPGYLGSPNVVIQDNRRLRKVTTQVAGVELYRHHLSGMPATKILEFVQRNEPQLLVLGTHGRRGLGRILGSVASKVMREATCPVMILRQRRKSDREIESQCAESTQS